MNVHTDFSKWKSDLERHAASRSLHIYPADAHPLRKVPVNPMATRLLIGAILCGLFCLCALAWLLS